MSSVNSSRREALLEFEGDVVGEHAEEDVRADAVFEVVVDRADLDRVLHRAERALGHLELLVGADRGAARRAGVRGEGGADHVEAVEGGLAGDLLGLALVGEGAVGDLQGEVLGDLVLVDRRVPARSPILPASAPRRLPRGPATIAVTLSSSASVAASSSARLRARSAATAGLRHTTSRSPGNSGEVISARLISSNSDSCRSPEFTSERICALFSALMKSTPCSLRRGGVRLGDHPAVADEHDVLDPEPLTDGRRPCRGRSADPG